MFKGLPPVPGDRGRLADLPPAEAPWGHSGAPRQFGRHGSEVPPHAEDLARRVDAAFLGRSLGGELAAASFASFSSRARRSLAVLAWRRAASSPVMTRAAWSVMSALVSGLVILGLKRAYSVMDLLMSASSFRKQKGRAHPAFPMRLDGQCQYIRGQGPEAHALYAA